MSVPNFGDNYRGGYSTSTGTFSSSDELREASSTFANYISGTIYLTFLIFLSFMLVSIMTLIIMGYARYLAKRTPIAGFYNPPPMISRHYHLKTFTQGTYTSLPRSDFGSISQQKFRISTAMSRDTIASHRSTTAISAVL